MKERVDQTFIDILNNVKINAINDHDEALLKSRIIDEASTTHREKLIKLIILSNII